MGLSRRGQLPRSRGTLRCNRAHDGDVRMTLRPSRLRIPALRWVAGTGLRYFRFYNPTEAYFDRSWPLPDFE
jgi:hypothetical protein